MNILSLFDGMSCGQIALNQLGIEYDNYFASEIDKWAIQITQHNYPNTIQLGDIDDWQKWSLPEIDLIMAGSPCQGFSNAGKGLNFDDPRSKLYFVFEDVLRHYQPAYWLLENVVMRQKWQDIISQRLGIKPIMIDSALVSAQTRKRLYWTNIYNQLDMFGYPYCVIPQPVDKKKVLADIIEDGFVDRQKSFCLDSNYQKTSETSTDRYFRKGARQIVFNQPVLIDAINDSQDGRVVLAQGKSFTLTAKHNNYPKIAQGAAQRGRYKKGSKISEQQIELNYSGKSNTLTSVQKDSLVSNGQSWRKLSPLECERLQTVPDNYTFILDENGKQQVSNTQRYKMLGNGWTVDVICHILGFMK